MKRFSTTIIGIFVLGALLLAVVGVISFGAQAWWREREFVAMYFNESVQGLDRGSAVKLMGVSVGRVSAINVTYLSGSATAVEVICEIDRSPFAGNAGGDVEMRDREILQEMVDSGLQARLELIGITGLLYIEMDFFEEPSARALALDNPDYVVVPTLPASFAGLVDNLAQISKELGTIDFAGLGESAAALLNTTNTILEEAKLKELIVEMRKTVDGVNQLLSSEELQRTIGAAGDSFEDFSRLARRLEAEVDPLSESVTASSDELRETLREVGQTFTDIQTLIGPQMGLGFQLGNTLNTIDEAARSIERLADFLERNPQAILRGRSDER